MASKRYGISVKIDAETHKNLSEMCKKEGFVIQKLLTNIVNNFLDEFDKDTTEH